MSSENNNQHGFTLVELMVVLALVAILVTIGIPGFNNMIRDNRLITGTNELVSSIALARSEAIRRGLPVTVCASTTGTNCTASNWNQGWIVFTDQGTADTVDGTDTVLRVQQALAGDVQINAGGTTPVRYGATGFLAFAPSAEIAPGLFAATHQPESLHTPLSRAIAMLLPGQPAYAGNDHGRYNSRNHGDGHDNDNDRSDDGSQSEDSDNSNRGDGNNGNGVGNTGPGNQGNDMQVGNAGGSGSGSGGVAGPAAQSTFTFCDGRNGETGHQVTIMASGRVASETVACN